MNQSSAKRWRSGLLALSLALAFQGVAKAATPQDKAVTVEIVERGVPAKLAWPVAPGAPSERYQEPAFAFVHIPWRYGETGVRVDRGSPFLVRASANMPLPVGKLRLLVRGRNAVRLSIDGRLVAELPFVKANPSGHGTLRTNVLKLGNTRYVGAGDNEKLVEYQSNGSSHRVVLEVIVGGPAGNVALRPELGETLVAFAPADRDEFLLLAPTLDIGLNDADWDAYIAERLAHYEQVEADRRQTARRAYSAFWNARHEAARAWIGRHPAPAVPAAPASYPIGTPVDAFLGTAWQRALDAAIDAKGSVRFHRDVLPVLTERCLTCHGTQPKGGLRLDSAKAALRGGDSGEPAINPGKPEESELITRLRADDPGEIMPPKGKGERLKAAEIATIEQWIREGASWPAVEPAYNVELAPTADDLTFLRRLFLDVVGVPPTLEELRALRSDTAPGNRARWIERLLNDPRWADVWTARWQDWLGENPNLVNATLNNTGPFRWWIYESFRDNVPMDLFAWELITMPGSSYNGGPAGFGLAAQNDAPMVAKAGVLSSTLLATEMKCARCHDAPYHASRQADLFHLAAMLAREPVKVPATSSVPLDKLSAGGRQPLIRVTLKPGEPVSPEWPLETLVPAQAALATSDSRVRLALLLTDPGNERFAQVLVNRVWHHYFGTGIVEPLNDWEKAKPSHPELLQWLARELVSHDYNLKHVARLILNSQAYQRQASSNPAANRLYAAPARRRLSAEQLVDTVFASFGVPIDVEPMCIDRDGGRPPGNGLNLGQPRRAWQFAYLSNERDRPSLNLPRAQAVTELLSAFGWPGVRQEAISDRKTAPNILQPALLSNGSVARWLTRLSDDSELTELCLGAATSDDLVRDLFLRILTRQPTAAELQDFSDLLEPGFDTRIRSLAKPPATQRAYTPYVAWSNHLDPNANAQRQREEAAARLGALPTSRLDNDWRERAEDALWTLLNAPELVYSP